MLKACEENDKEKVLKYIGEDFGRCIYIYIDILKYSLNDDNFHVWLQYNAGSEITAVISEYHKGIQIYSKENDLNVEEIVMFLETKDSPIILGTKRVIDKFEHLLKGYTKTEGVLGELKDFKFLSDKKVLVAGEDDIEDIAGLVSEDDDIGKPYGYESIYRQYHQRQTEGFGRNYIIRDELTGEIICHAATYAETQKAAVLGGAITAPGYRKKGFSKCVISSLCKDLIDEGKRVFSFFYVPAAEKMHYSVGFEKIEDWSKLVRI